MPLCPSSLVLLECLIKSKPTKSEITERNRANSNIALIKLKRKAVQEMTVIKSRKYATLPSLKPLLNLRGTLRRYLILPVPVVFLLIAFSLQLSKTTIKEQTINRLVSRSNCTSSSRSYKFKS